jgi:hypothetical protein
MTLSPSKARRNNTGGACFAEATGCPSSRNGILLNDSQRVEKLKDMINLNPNHQLMPKKSCGCFATNNFFVSSRESTIRGRISGIASSRTEQTHQTTETHQVHGSQAIDCRILLIGSIAEKHQR